MGCVSSVFQYGSYIVDEKAAPENKEDGENATGDVPSTQELPSKSAEEESAKEQAAKTEASKPDEQSEQKNDETAEPVVKEYERVREVKLEKEKTVKESGETTEKTVFTEIQESVKVEETKGPVSDPFSSKKEKSKSSFFPSFSKDSSVFMSETSSTRPTSTVSQSSSEFYHPVIKEEKIPESVVEPSGLFATGVQSTEPQTSTEVVDDGAANVNEAVVKIQAGVRGYLTRKSLKEKKEKTEPAAGDDGPKSGDLLVDIENRVEESIMDENLLTSDKDLMEFLQEGNIDNPQLNEQELSWLEEDACDGQEQAATKIQAAFRGYKVRKDISK